PGGLCRRAKLAQQIQPARCSPSQRLPSTRSWRETARVHDAVITVPICPGGHGLCESAFGSAYAAKVYVGQPELMQSRPEGTPKCLEGREPTYVEPPAAPKVECRGAART